MEGCFNSQCVDCDVEMITSVSILFQLLAGVARNPNHELRMSSSQSLRQFDAHYNSLLSLALNCRNMNILTSRAI